MNTPLLRKLAKRKNGWKPTPIHDDKGLIRNACMVTNGSISTKIEVPVLKDLEKMDMLLEVQVLKAINSLNERDDAIIKKQTLVFSVLAAACVDQAEGFRPLVHQDGKHELNKFVNNTERLVKSLQKDFIAMGGEQMGIMLVELKEVAKRVFGALGSAIDSGIVPEFLDNVEKFVKPIDAPVVQLEVEQKKTPKKNK